ncbi:hypothetical protein HMPREF9436_02570 [Faecalibacterium cf. prausnitzii KLE1255]|uniref:Uncharacterized protein n=1 Tax=Faecalibacterium cf. prausnitzii KLE1255 TaxID=748224 RepID=E2ZLL1_9FIRM|nr:hypothetical protein HMPREF9436_02570 [Faecalibacterium cf. prausnitzii KLE1255]
MDAGQRAAFSSDTNRAIPSPALLPSATGSHPSGRSSEKLPAVLLGQMQLSITTLLVKMCLERPAGRDKHEIKTKSR